MLPLGVGDDAASFAVVDLQIFAPPLEIAVEEALLLLDVTTGHCPPRGGPLTVVEYVHEADPWNATESAVADPYSSVAQHLIEGPGCELEEALDAVGLVARLSMDFFEERCELGREVAHSGEFGRSEKACGNLCFEAFIGELLRKIEPAPLIVGS